MLDAHQASCILLWRGSIEQVRALLVRGYSISGGLSQRRGVGPIPMFCVARCWTWSDFKFWRSGWVPSGPVRILQIDTDRYGSIVLSLGYRWATDPVGLAFGWDSIRIEIEPVTTELRDVCIAFCILPSYHLGWPGFRGSRLRVVFGFPRPP